MSASIPSQPSFPNSSVAPRSGGVLRHILAGVFLLAMGVWNLPSGYPHRISGNLNVAEGIAWTQGRLDIPHRIHDYAYYNGKLYNVYPPLVSILSAITRPLYPSDGIPGWVVTPIIILPIFVLSYLLFFRLTGSILAATGLCLFWLFGTPLYPILIHAKLSAAVYQVNNAMSQIGILLILVEFFGRRRAWPMCLGLIITAWTRQITAAYLLPITWVIWKEPDRRRSGLTLLGATVAVCAVVPMALNTLKFGNPLQSGYKYISGDLRSHPDGIGTWHGLFSPRYIPQNIYYGHLRPPPLAIDEKGRLRYAGDFLGSSMWITTPVLVLFWIDIRRFWQNTDRRVLLISMAMIATGLLMYYNTGAYQKGYYRYLLDYLAPMLALMAPRLFNAKRRWIAIGLMAASAVYFRCIMNYLLDYRVIFDGFPGF